mmetsp:Transcript_5496/g.11966  ORF Transcript_5496/g.11966 Transcript_5496/m.11966 type:complete len:482 (+) Transcript_5496:270-1715(+)|eukprot:CAMPEP_0172552926 /NCGR_PEP_ID=MMETSP1067-20121228/47273_1 /TAXON_ID=265564 ORGANISM="Thalassiosira punctigera, Strain Tpunct2005C2" /NCGR_SAMPLE_ID=MMETSP1067 /ASSEMBLY_ACC=CAM_ASM_000444 /LENGTH=481 /DNA_ID=CAMNT_0013341001 /DNA_START=190 /DNA_END=1635 /DNA_ORIENTATION=-
MFTNMLRPSRRHAHERISQEDANDSNNDGDNDNVASAAGSAADQNSGPTIVVIDDQQQLDLNLMEVPLDGGDEGESATAVGGNDVRASNQDGNVGGESSESDENQNNRNLRRGSRSPDGSDEDEEGNLQPDPTTHPFLTSQIHAERELRYRRQSTCTLLILFFLIRLWIEAILKKDVGLIFLSMMGTTWTYRWFVSRRAAEEDYDRQIAEERNAAAGGLEGAVADREGTGAGTGADAAVNFDPDLGLMSFQAQLALAILESQRQMFENGGYGGNDLRGAGDGPGVTDEAKGKWKSYEWGDDAEETARLAGLTRTSSAAAIKRSGSNDSNYGSVSTALTEDDEGYDEGGLDKSSKLEGGLLPKGFDDEEPSCSICLCEYELGEKVIRLPCDHVYHETCLASWTENHVRCPLCNCDLMEGFEQPACVRRARQVAEEQRAFRNMALSTLGRRIRTRRSAGRRGARSTTAAALAAAAEDSVDSIV